MKLSIGKAWDETKAVVARDGSPLLAVALALLVLPGAIIETAAPSSLREEDAPAWLAFAGLAVALLSLVAQIAISRIALGPPTTVGAALGLAFRRLPILSAALLLITLPFILVAVAMLLSQGAEVDPENLPPVLAIPVLLLLLAALYLLIRLLFLTPLAADREDGPVGLIRGAWRLSKGRSSRLFGLILLLMIIGLVVLGGLGGAISAVVILVLGEVAPFNLSAMLVALVQQFLSALVSLVFAIVVARLYAQAVAGDAPASVPSAGGE